jgi:xanthine dehydrogenase YagS FAD-binding subunit
VKAFSYVRPTTTESVLDELALDGSDGVDVKLLGGGTNLVDLMKLGVETPTRLVDVTDLPYAMVSIDDDGVCTIGGLARNSDVAVDPDLRSAFPVISEALLSGASGQLRNVATAAGNLLQRTRCSYFLDVTKPCNKRAPGSGCPAMTGEHHNLAILGGSDHCIATHPSDFAVALSAVDARLGVVGPAGTRELSIHELYVPVADTPHHETTLGSDEILTSIVVAPLSTGSRSHYRKVRERASYAFAIGSIAVVASVANDRIDDVRIALGAVASHPWRARTAEAVLQGQRPTLAILQDAADAELAAARPLPGNAYKVDLVRELIVSELAELLDVGAQASGGLA